MQDKLVFKLETQTAGGGSNNMGSGSNTNGLSSTMSSLNESIKNLSVNLKSFSEKIGRVKEGPNKTSSASYAQETARIRTQASMGRANFNNSPEGREILKARADAGVMRNQAEMQKQELRADILKRATEYKALGDTKFAKKLEESVATNLGSGINKGLSNSKLGQVFTAIGGAAMFVKGANQLIGAETQAGLSMMQNPYTGGYNYGGQVSGVMQAQTQRENAGIGIATAVIGGLAALIPGIGAVAGAGIMGAGQIYGAYNTSQTTLKSTAASALVNNTMNAQALSATNQAASGIYNGGMQGRRITDAEQGLVLAMSKTAAVYNRNFKAVDKLTDYVLASQMSIQQAAGMSAGVGFLTKGMTPQQENNFIEGMKQSYSAYGINDYAGTTANAMLFKQAGMDPMEAAELAARSTGLNSGAQGALSNYYSQPLSNRAIQNYVSKNLYGVDLQKLTTGEGDPTAEKYRKELLGNISRGTLPTNPRAMGFEALYNLTNSQTVGKEVESGAITSTSTQKQIRDMINQTTANNADGMSIDKAIGVLAGESTKASSALDTLASTVSHTTSLFNNLASTLGNMALGGTGKMFISPSPAAPKSGNTGNRYNINDYYKDNNTGPSKIMDKLNSAPVAGMSMKQQVKM